jgi:hypothetical protein
MVKLFMDESGNGNPSRPLIVGAVELGDTADDVEAQVQNLAVSGDGAGSPGEAACFGELPSNGVGDLAAELVRLARGRAGLDRAFELGTNRARNSHRIS